VRDLLRGFVPADRVDAFDFDTLEPIPAHYVFGKSPGRTYASAPPTSEPDPGLTETRPQRYLLRKRWSGRHLYLYFPEVE